MQTSVTSCPNLKKWCAEHTDMDFLRKEVPLCFPGDQGSSSMTYQFILSNFKPWLLQARLISRVH